MSGDADLVRIFLGWIGWRAALHRGWWLVTSVYLVVDARLSPSELVLIGVAQGTVALAFEVPAGVVADTISRKWSLVVSHVLMGTAMIATGSVTDFAPLVATQILWGLSWTFSSGADVAWITDELAEPGRIAVVLVRAGRAELVGSAAGIVGVGAVASLLQRSTAMTIAGAAMLLLGLYVAFRFPEQFEHASTKRWAASRSILARGWDLVRHDRAILLMFAATFLVNGAADASGRMQPRRLVELGLPSEPVVWFAALGVLILLVGSLALRVVQLYIDGASTAVRGYAIACAAGAIGLMGLAVAPEVVSGSAAVLLFGGIAVPLTRTIATIWVNRQTSDDVRATVHSFLAQAEYSGEIACGLAIAAVAQLGSLTLALLACGALFATTIVLVQGLGTSGNAKTAG
ncbi:MAG: MFS transporter [Candidatus Limnocylindria bacterium]